MDMYTACSIAEGFTDKEYSFEEQLNAWAYLIKTGAAWSLQGWYGRTATNLIQGGVISADGVVNWELAYELSN